MADDCLFVVREFRLMHAPLTAIRIVAVGDLDRFEALLDEKPPEAAENAFGRGWLSHMSADKQREESVDLLVGIPDAEYTGLFEDILAQRFDQLSVHCLIGAYSTASDYESPRDIVMVADQSIPVSVTDMSVERVLGSPTQLNAQ